MLQGREPTVWVVLVLLRWSSGPLSTALTAKGCQRAPVSALGVWWGGIGLFPDGYVLVPTVRDAQS